MYLLSSDRDTLTGLRLAGIKGELVQNRQAFLDGCQKAVRDEQTGILLITSSLGELYGKEIIELKKSTSLLITEIPDMNSGNKKSDSISRYVREAIGIKV